MTPSNLKSRFLLKVKWFKIKFYFFLNFLKCVSDTCACRVQVCVGCKCVSGASVLGCMCVSGACVCRVQVCVGYMCVLDTSVCRGKVCVGDKSSRGHVSLNLYSAH